MPNKYAPHVLVVPEDAAVRDVVNGFVERVVNSRAIRVERPAGGWSEVQEAVAADIYGLSDNSLRQLVVVVDFDTDPRRGDAIRSASPGCIADRVFVVGPMGEIEDLRRDLVQAGIIGPNTLEAIGRLLADECRDGTTSIWTHDRLRHNEPTYRHMLATLRPILFD